MAAPKYPFYMYRPGAAPVYVTGEVLEERCKKEGFSKKYVHSHFPKILYGPKGETAKVENESEMQAKIAEGYGEDFVDKPKADEAKEAAPDSRSAEKLVHLRGRVEDHDQDLEDLKNDFKELTESFDQHWSKQAEEIEALKAEVAALKASSESLT